MAFYYDLKDTSFFCFALVFSSLDAQRRLSQARTLTKKRRGLSLRSRKLPRLGKKRNSFLSHFPRFFRIFVIIRRISLYKGDAEDWEISMLRFGDRSQFNVLL